MKRTHRSQLAGVLALVIMTLGADIAGAQSDSHAETGSGTLPTGIETGRDSVAEGGLFDLLQSGGATQTLVTGEGNVMTLPVGEPEDRQPIYRTICVRLCDGYYFPMSPASSRNDFARDQQNCQSICPGADTRIYYQLSNEQDADAMISAATEEPYSGLSAAYLYKQPDAPERAECSCGSIAVESGYSIVGDERRHATDRPAGSSIIYPGFAAEPEPAPEPQADVGALLRPTRTDIPVGGKRKVRVVGPAFLPGQEAAEGLPIQDRKTDR